MDDETLVSGSEAPVTTETVEDQPNQADVQVTNEAPEAAPETKDSSVNATETAEDKLYAGKYKSVEDLEKAYKNASSEATKLSQERAQLSNELQSTFELEEAQSPILDSNGYVDPVAEKIERLERNDSVSRFIFAHPDADGNAVKEILTTDPIIQQIQSYDARLEYAFLKSQNMSSKKAVEEAKKTAATQTQAKILEKQTAQVESNSQTQKVDENSELYARATGNYSQVDRDEARRALIRKNLINL